MNAPAGPRTGPLEPDYLCRRVVDALLREDVRGCLGQAKVIDGGGLPFAALLSPDLRDGAWLCNEDIGDGALWLAVEPSRFMQDWRLRALPAVWCTKRDTVLLYTLPEILALFRAGLDSEDRGHHEAFAEECRVAEEHRALCEAERAHRFARPAEFIPHWPEWSRSLLYHDWLASFHDHPFYPTARAKLGFTAADLRAYAPEFGASFLLRWMAVPRALYQGAVLPPELRPDFAAIGLGDALAQDHLLVPVHPALWGDGLDAFLSESGLTGAVMRAPSPWLAVTPTLSVRTVVPLAHPHLHLKLPLAMRTLGTRNLRTIKPGTIADGATVQAILGAVKEEMREPGEHLLLTDEDVGATVDGRTFLGFILRRYPAGLADEAVAPVAALAAPAPDGRMAIEALAERFYGGDVLALFADYLDLTLRLHLTLWVRYGIALEANQQNSLVVLSHAEPRLRLMLKDNDAARLHGHALTTRRPDLAARVDAIHDRRIVVDGELPLAQMFITITLQLNVAVLVEALADGGHADRCVLYRQVRAVAADTLDALAAAGDDVTLARRMLLEAERLPLKYLLRAASLEGKARTGAVDINKFYGTTAPNILRDA